MATMCLENCSDAGILYEVVSEEIWAPWNAVMYYLEYQPWFFSLLGSLMVGLAGIFPLLIIPIDGGTDLKTGAGAGTLKMLLSFAVGGLLGDVFLHLLPEAWANKALNGASENGHPSMTCGLWVLSGFLVFIIAEKMFVGMIESGEEDDEDEDEPEDSKDESTMLTNNNSLKELENNNCLRLEDQVKNGFPKNGFIANGVVKKTPEMNGVLEINENSKNGYTKNVNGLLKSNGFVKSPEEMNLAVPNSDIKKRKSSESKEKSKRISGYLNLLANSIDNFTHGLAVGGSFLVSFRLGALTTLAILVHEIPHEVGDFAILLRSGFNRWDAARAQLLTAGGGIFGALIAVVCSGGGIEARTSWILPFTAGGFLHIGLVTVLPELLQETDPKESLKQLGALLIGISLMALMTALSD